VSSGARHKSERRQLAWSTTHPPKGRLLLVRARTPPPPPTHTHTDTHTTTTTMPVISLKGLGTTICMLGAPACVIVFSSIAALAFAIWSLYLHGISTSTCADGSFVRSNSRWLYRTPSHPTHPHTYLLSTSTYQHAVPSLPFFVSRRR